MTYNLTVTAQEARAIAQLLVRFGTWTSNADAPVNGYITVKDYAGNTRKLATIA